MNCTARAFPPARACVLCEFRAQHSMSVCRVCSVHRSNPAIPSFLLGIRSRRRLSMHCHTQCRRYYEELIAGNQILGPDFPASRHAFPAIVGGKRAQSRMLILSNCPGKNLLSNRKNDARNNLVRQGDHSAYQSEVPGSGPGDSRPDPGPILPITVTLHSVLLQFN